VPDVLVTGGSNGGGALDASPQQPCASSAVPATAAPALHPKRPSPRCPPDMEAALGKLVPKQKEKEPPSKS